MKTWKITLTKKSVTREYTIQAKTENQAIIKVNELMHEFNRHLIHTRWTYSMIEMNTETPRTNLKYVLVVGLIAILIAMTHYL